MYVLLIDDSKIDNAVNKKLLALSRISEDIEVFTDAKASLVMINEMSDSWTSPRLVLLDLNMPNMDGVQWLKEFRKLPSSIQQLTKIYVLSGSIDRKQLDIAEEDPSVLALLEKPLDVYQLQQLIKYDE
ncbi:MAG: hypothetical protein COA49_00645 [Bacteroidetes bacterium]|nr:MAG: hypothetical protein COA49_00645 [Bacteroidota bacterium]